MVAIIYDRAVIDSKSAEKSPKFKRGMPARAKWSGLGEIYLKLWHVCFWQLSNRCPNSSFNKRIKTKHSNFRSKEVFRSITMQAATLTQITEQSCQFVFAQNIVPWPCTLVKTGLRTHSFDWLIRTSEQNCFSTTANILFVVVCLKCILQKQIIWKMHRWNHQQVWILLSLSWNNQPKLN